MSGIEILRRDASTAGAYGQIATARREARRSAFESNLALQLEKNLGGDASLKEIGEITNVLGAAYQNTKHAVDARTSFKLGFRRYFVFQAGFAPRTGDERIDSIEPFAARLIAGLDPTSMQVIEPRLKAVGQALSKTEIAVRHPLDWRPKLTTPWFRVYATLLSGRDRRRSATNISHDRRIPVNESIGLLLLLTIVAFLSLLGVGLILSTLWAFSELVTNEAGRSSLSSFLANSVAALQWGWRGGW